MKKLPERDWKAMRAMHDELLERLAKRINDQSKALLASKGKPQIDLYRDVYKHIEDSDRIIADCFNDWRRSTLDVKLSFLRHHGLLTDQDIEKLSEETRKWLFDR